jgi:ribonuclease P protein component
MTKGQGLARSEKLTRKSDFDRVQKQGHAHRFKELLVLALPNESSRPRLGMVVGRRVGGSVVRNRFKRVIREAFRLNKHLLTVGHDLLVIPRPGKADVQLSALEKCFRQVFTKLGER